MTESCPDGSCDTTEVLSLRAAQFTVQQASEAAFEPGQGESIGVTPSELTSILLEATLDHWRRLAAEGNITALLGVEYAIEKEREQLQPGQTSTIVNLYDTFRKDQPNG